MDLNSSDRCNRREKTTVRPQRLFRELGRRAAGMAGSASERSRAECDSVLVRHSGTVRQHQIRNLEIAGSPLRGAPE